jgi:hypothetical protein
MAQMHAMATPAIKQSFDPPQAINSSCMGCMPTLRMRLPCMLIYDNVVTITYTQGVGLDTNMRYDCNGGKIAGSIGSSGCILRRSIHDYLIN